MPSLPLQNHWGPKKSSAWEASVPGSDDSEGSHCLRYRDSVAPNHHDGKGSAIPSADSPHGQYHPEGNMLPKRAQSGNRKRVTENGLRLKSVTDCRKVLKAEIGKGEWGLVSLGWIVFLC